MYARSEIQGIRIGEKWLAKGESIQISKELAEQLKKSVAAGQVTIHSKNPAAKKVSARKAKSAPGMEALEQSVSGESGNE